MGKCGGSGDQDILAKLIPSLQALRVKNYQELYEHEKLIASTDLRGKSPIFPLY